MTDQTTDAERLRAAATRLRERAEAATPGPWASPPEGRRVHGPREADDLGRGPSAILAAEMPWRPGRMQANADYVATMHPGVALALADWLDDLADHDPSPLMPTEAGAFKVADAVLGGGQR